jgi:hypothetical protein
MPNPHYLGGWLQWNLADRDPQLSSLMTNHFSRREPSQIVSLQMNSDEIMCCSGFFDDAYIVFGFNQWLFQ